MQTLVYALCGSQKPYLWSRDALFCVPNVLKSSAPAPTASPPAAPTAASPAQPGCHCPLHSPP